MKNRLWNIMQQEVRNNLRRRSYLVMTFGLPLLLILAVAGMVFFYNRQPEPEREAENNYPQQPLGYVDQSGLFGEPGPFVGLFIPYTNETAARDNIATDKIAGYYLIPHDYLATGQVIRYAAQINVTERDVALFESFLLTSLLAAEEPHLAARVQAPAIIVEHLVDAAGTAEVSSQAGGMDLFWLVYAFAMLMMLTTFLTAGQLTQSVINEKENRMIEVVLSSVRPLQLMAGKLIGQGLLGLLQLLTWLGTVVVVIQLADVHIPFLSFLVATEIPPSLLAIALLYFLLGFALFGTFAASVGAISANLREGPQYAVLYSLPAALPVMFLPTIAQTPNSTLAVVFSLFPLCSPIGMVERLVVTAVPPGQLVLSLSLLALSVIAGLWLSARLFQVNTLLAGQLPTRKQLWRLLRYG
jgi:ABC-2 type transport system permease protein